MEKEFVPYEQALELKKIGFDEPCFGFFYEDEEFELCPVKNNNLLGYTNAPLYQQAFRWFREKYYLHSCISAMNNGIELLYAPLIDIINKATLDFDVYISYEEAELECLKKLIEIVKEQKLND